MSVLLWQRSEYRLQSGICQRRDPLGIVQLAELEGRDYTTVSRQVAKLESLGQVARCPSPDDGRLRAAIVSDEGRAMTQALDAARQKVIEGLFADWETRDVRELSRLLRRFADDAPGWVKSL